MKRQKKAYSSTAIIFFAIFFFQNLSLAGQAAETDSLMDERQKEIQKFIERDRINAQCWWYGWLGAYSAATVGQGIVYFSSDSKATRQDMALGSATTLLGALGQIVTPLVPRTSSGHNSRSADSLVSLNSQEFLREIAMREKAGRSWKVHAVTGVVNIGSGLITWLGFKRSFRDGVENFILNTAVTEAQIWTQPVRAAKDYERFYGKYSQSAANFKKPEKEWFVSVYPGGVSIKLRF